MNIRNRKGLISILLIICVVSVSFVALRFTSAEYEAHDAHQTIYVDPSSLRVTPCTEFTVNVRIRNVTNLYAWQFNMTFDPNLMQCVNVTEGEFLSNVGPTIWPNPIIDNTNGEIMAGCSLFMPGPGASGGCVLAYVTFHCTAVGESNLVLHDTMLLDSVWTPIDHDVEEGSVQQAPIYRYKVKFEYGWQSEFVGTHFPSLNIPVETFTTTHINVYNPNDCYVPVKKYFVKVWPESRVYEYMANCNYLVIPEDWAGRTCHMHIQVPERKGFEIDAEDVLSWPADPSNPIRWLVSESFWKGFVVIECPYELEVVAVYDKVGVDVVNKITFHIEWPTYLIGTYTPPPPGPGLMYNTPYSIEIKDPPELASWEDLVREGLEALDIPVGPDQEPEPTEDYYEIEVYFDFLECVAIARTQFILRPPISEWYNFLDYVWPPSQRPEGWTWPDWFEPCKLLEKIVKIRSYPYLDPTVWETFWSMGDVNNDGYIDQTDADLIAGHFCTGDPQYDINKDGHVDALDTTICASNVGKDIWTYSGMPPQESWGPLEKIRDPERMVRENLNSTLIELGVPTDKATAIVNQLNIEIIELDVAEGVGTGIDVEYIEPELITTP